MDDELPIEELEAIAKTDIGEVLRLTRIHYNKSLYDVEQVLRIRACQLSAIEKGDMSKLPGKAYAIGFVRSYAEYLGIDEERVVQLFKAQYMDSQDQEKLSFPIPASETKNAPIWVVILSIFISILFFIILANIDGKEDISGLHIIDIPKDIKNHIDNEIITLNKITQNQESKTLPSKEKSKITPYVEDMGNNKKQQDVGIVLNIIDNSWVEIKDSDGNIIVSNILEKGEQYFIPNNPDLTMSLGNAANVEIIIDGRTLMPLGKDGDVRRDIPLNTAYLKTLEFREETP